MHASVETLSELRRKLTVYVTEERIQQEVQKRLNALSYQIKIDGFRQGRVPYDVVKKRYGLKVREEVLNEMVQSSFDDALRDNKLRLAGEPEVKIHKIDDGEGLEFDAHFEIMPEFVLMPLEALEVKRYHYELTEEDIDAAVQRLRERQRIWNEVDRPAALGDRVVVSFEGWDGEESFTNGRVEDFPILLGSHTMIPGFEEKLLGMSAGTTCEFEIDFPNNYPGEKMVGKTGRFSVSLLHVEEGILPELEPGFIRSYGVLEGDVPALRREVRFNLEREIRRELRNRNRSSVMDQLHANNRFTLPDVLVQNEINELITSYRASAEKQDRLVSDEAQLKEQSTPLAQRRVALALILGKLVDTYSLVVDPVKVRAMVKELASDYEEPQEVIRWYYAQKERLREVENLVMEEQIVELVMKKSRINEETLSMLETIPALPHHEDVIAEVNQTGTIEAVADETITE